MLTLLCCVQGHSFHLGFDWKVPLPWVQSTITWHSVWVFHLWWVSGGRHRRQIWYESQGWYKDRLWKSIDRQSYIGLAYLFLHHSEQALHQSELQHKVSQIKRDLLPQDRKRREIVFFVFPFDSVVPTYQITKYTELHVRKTGQFLCQLWFVARFHTIGALTHNSVCFLMNTT